MKIKFGITIIICAFIFQACKNNVEEISEVKESVLLPDMSIYNLSGEWLTQDSSTIKLESYRGDIVVVALMYASCKAACPKIISDMINIEKNIKPEELQKVKFILISIDPQNDTPLVLKKTATEYQMDLTRWTLITGTESNVRDIAAVLSFKYKKSTPTDFVHSNIISVLDMDGALAYQQSGIESDNTQTLNMIHTLIAQKN
ncbi:MAG: SCO family protein [Chitinophagales bacterium]